ncbi:SpoIID/LytB domain-containing protein [Blastococcus haudaquaticus]|uniref:SpoIID/LytB domain protein n=1 Tax=Blastococcus haudaquaticus TaxID=1938745 RepID=A0A286GE46_9ACTN|nr:SpoIID/LytB domain-containing protein [Blastococcus haudaquaticus]SOD93768.1 SpoIID/LytB domain protein [Blastococcus haudaquaticus]
MSVSGKAGSRPWRRWGTAGLVMFLTTAALATTVVRSPEAQAASDKAVVPAGGVIPLVGHGYGHGRGMSQYGAYGAATTGASAGQILDFYYAGTTSQSNAPWGVKVRITTSDGPLTVLPDAGLVVQDLKHGTTTGLPAGPAAWRIVRAYDSAGRSVGYGVHFQVADGSWQAFTFAGRQITEGPLQFSGPEIVRMFRPGDVRGFRGSLIGIADGGGLATVNALSFQDYLRGVVPREMPASWPAAALQAQSIAARTYALYKIERKPAGQMWDICDTTACQVYGGARTWVNGRLTLSEEPATNAAIDATNNVVRRSGAATINAEFSSSNGGWTADGGTSYTLARQDPWDGIVSSSAHRWSDTITAGELQAAFPAVGTLRSLEITDRDGRGEWGGRVLKVVLRGVASGGGATAVTVTGNQIRSAGALKSNWFSFDVPLSAIDARYASDAGLRQSLGAPVGGERWGAGFSFREYANGRLYWSGATDVRVVRGEILRVFLASGGAEVLGVPSTDEGQAGAGGAFNHFTRGTSIYWSPGTGAQVMRGAIRDRWLRTNAEWGLGYPTGGEVPVAGVAGAWKQTFQRGEVYWSEATGAFDLRGGLAQAWAAAGGASRLGLPTTGEVGVPGGAFTQDFSRGYTLVWTSSGTRLVLGGIRDVWLARGGARGVLGLPLHDEAPTSGGGWYVEFTGGTVVWTASSGAVALTGPIGARWSAAGGLGSSLGLPVAVQRATSDGRGQFVAFASGAGIYQPNGSAQAFLVAGDIGRRWTAWGGVSGLGLPIIDETRLGTGAGTFQVFARGKVFSSAGTGVQVVYGAVGAAYDSVGAEWSRLGLPTSGEYAVPGGVRADFQGGRITWTAATNTTTITYT